MMAITAFVLPLLGAFALAAGYATSSDNGSCLQLAKLCKADSASVTNP